MSTSIPVARRAGILMAVTLSVAVSACGAESTAFEPPGTTAPPVSAADGGAETPDNLFPDVDVQNVADGSTLNLQEELQGGDVPVLLWFWAPH